MSINRNFINADLNKIWSKIFILHFLLILFQIIFIIGGLFIFVYFASIDIDHYFDVFWKYMALMYLILILIPNSCPKCGKTFLLLSVYNWPLLLLELLKNFINPIKTIFTIFSKTCPHCGLGFRQEINSDQ